MRPERMSFAQSARRGCGSESVAAAGRVWPVDTAAIGRRILKARCEARHSQSGPGRQTEVE
jgi:hypothetical protein